MRRGEFLDDASRVDLTPGRLGILGGTFDPVHIGHLIAAQEARSQFHLDEVVFVTAGRPWQKAEITPAETRFFMTLLATRGNPGFKASRIELDRPGPSYTVETLRQFRQIYGPEVELFFVAGSDSLAQIETWREYRQVLSLANVIAANRPGHEFNADAVDGGRCILPMQIPAVEASSSDIRQRVAEGKSIRYLVPEAVEKFIYKHGLYR